VLCVVVWLGCRLKLGVPWGQLGCPRADLRLSQVFSNVAAGPPSPRLAVRPKPVRQATGGLFLVSMGNSEDYAFAWVL